MNCSNCSTPLGPGVMVCPNCGTAAPRAAAVHTGQPVAAPGGHYPGAAPLAYGQKKTNTMAIVSLCFGIGSWVVIPFIGAIVAIITGHMARKEIWENASQFEGDGLALGGLITGYANIALSCI